MSKNRSTISAIALIAMVVLGGSLYVVTKDDGPKVPRAKPVIETPGLVVPRLQKRIAVSREPSCLVSAGGRMWAATPTEIVGIDPATNGIVARTTVALGIAPNASAVISACTEGAGSLWVAYWLQYTVNDTVGPTPSTPESSAPEKSGALLRVDPASGRIVWRYETEFIVGLAFFRDRVWLSRVERPDDSLTGSIVAIDPASRRVIEERHSPVNADLYVVNDALYGRADLGMARVEPLGAPLPDRLFDVTGDGSTAWGTTWDDELLAIDPTAGTVSTRIKIDMDPGYVTTDDVSVWITQRRPVPKGTHSLATGVFLSRIDKVTRAIDRQVVVPDALIPGHIARAWDSLWVADVGGFETGGSIVRFSLHKA